jgi:hypothetical protein
MTSKFSNKFLIPEEFPQILHDYAREVVRYMPKDILDFSIQYFYYLEKGLKLNYIDGGSKDIPKISDAHELKIAESNMSAPTNPNTQKMFYNKNETNQNNNNEKKETLTPINSEESRNSKQSAVTNGSGIVSLSKNFVNKIYEKSQRIVKELKENEENKGNIDDNRFNNTGDTFSNISGDDNDKTGVRSFVGNVMGDALKIALETIEKKNN